MAQSSTMEPLSARIPSDLYLWMAQLPVEGATTNSDKLRVLLGQLKRQHDGAFDYATANAWARDITHRLRAALVRLEGQSGEHSEVLASILDHVVAMLSTVMSSSPENATEAAALEDVLVRRSFALCEALLRQATTRSASAFDKQVVRRHAGTAIELAVNVSNLEGA